MGLISLIEPWGVAKKKPPTVINPQVMNDLKISMTVLYIQSERKVPGLMGGSSYPPGYTLDMALNSVDIGIRHISGIEKMRRPFVILRNMVLRRRRSKVYEFFYWWIIIPFIFIVADIYIPRVPQYVNRFRAR